jgi:hypothetical protein
MKFAALLALGAWIAYQFGRREALDLEEAFEEWLSDCEDEPDPADEFVTTQRSRAWCQ